MKMAKVAVLSLNPCIDKALYLAQRDTLPGACHRVEKTVENAAGKGLNQSIVLNRLGTEPLYLSFVSENSSHLMNRTLEELPFPSKRIPIACGIRENIKVIDKSGVGTEFNGMGGPVREEELNLLLEQVEKAPCGILSVCGSIPQPLKKDIYRTIITRAKERGRTVVLDADGEALKLGLEAHPDLIKPNRHELAGLFGLDETAFFDKQSIAEYASLVWQKYGTAVICTMDADGSLYVGREGIFLVDALPVALRGFAGAGDTYLASFIHAFFGCGWKIEQSLALASRASGAKISLEGSEIPSAALIESMPPVAVRRIG